eukprot:98566_1
MSGGAGHCTKGWNGKSGKGGKMCGDKNLKSIDFGSGGGGSESGDIGGNGGGIIKLYVSGKLVMNNGAIITANGGGAGGSIVIHCNDLQMSQNTRITACGGKGGDDGRHVPEM